MEGIKDDNFDRIFGDYIISINNFFKSVRFASVKCLNHNEITIPLEDSCCLRSAVFAMRMCFPTRLAMCAERCVFRMSKKYTVPCKRSYLVVRCNSYWVFWVFYLFGEGNIWDKRRLALGCSEVGRGRIGRKLFEIRKGCLEFRG